MQYRLKNRLLETDEGNAFTKARQDAIDSHEEEFELDDETYPVEGEKKYAFMETTRRYIRQMILECSCMENPGVKIEVEEDVVESVLDMITDVFIDEPINSYPEQHLDSTGRMFDYGDKKSDSHEGRMTKAKLFRMGKMAQSFHDRLEDGDDLPGWVQDKVTTAEDRLQSAYEYIDYKMNRMKLDGKMCSESTIRKITSNYLRRIL
jgi:hypothetical protein